MRSFAPALLLALALPAHADPQPLPAPTACGTGAIGYCNFAQPSPLSQLAVNTQTGTVSATSSADGQTYSAPGAATWGGFTDLPLYASDGSVLYVTAAFYSWRTCVTSGRGQHCTLWRRLTSGSVR